MMSNAILRGPHDTKESPSMWSHGFWFKPPVCSGSHRNTQQYFSLFCNRQLTVLLLNGKGNWGINRPSPTNFGQKLNETSVFYVYWALHFNYVIEVVTLCSTSLLEDRETHMIYKSKRHLCCYFSFVLALMNTTAAKRMSAFPLKK